MLRETPKNSVTYQLSLVSLNVPKRTDCLDTGGVNGMAHHYFKHVTHAHTKLNVQVSILSSDLTYYVTITINRIPQRIGSNFNQSVHQVIKALLN